jgi:hypothetical protein
VGQGSALSPILLALCLTPLLKEFERRVHVAVQISYVDNGTIIVQCHENSYLIFSFFPVSSFIDYLSLTIHLSLTIFS